MSNKINAGFLQFEPVLGNLSQTIRNIEAHKNNFRGADLIVLPELANSGYNFESREQAFGLAEDISNSMFLNFLHELCKEFNMHTVSGFNELDSNDIYNSSVLIGPKGLVGKYRKLHLFNNEKDNFTPGNLPLEIFDIGKAKIGMLVCFDWIFPETWRILALKGAEIICHPSNLVLPGFAQQAIPVYSLINNVYIITANRIGKEKDLNFTGMSTFSAPRGKIIKQAPQTEEYFFKNEIDLKLVHDRHLTPKNDIFEDRRADFYTEIVK